MKKKKLRPFVLPTLYLILLVLLMVLSTTNYSPKNEEKLTYVSGVIVNESIPVVKVDDVKINRPYQDEKVKIAKNYYNYQDDNTKQENSLIYYENTYIQNSGIDYSSEEAFDIISILDGTVIKVAEDELLGTTIEIRHDNNIISVYQSLSETKVKQGDSVTQGQVIAKSGTSKLNTNANNLHFEIYHDGMVLNPEDYYDKALSDL